MSGDAFFAPAAWGLTGREAQVLSALVGAVRLMTRDDLVRALYVGTGPPNSWPDAKIIDVMVCRIRQRLARALPEDAPNIIETVWGRGYRIDDEARAYLRASAAETLAASPPPPSQEITASC